MMYQIPKKNQTVQYCKQPTDATRIVVEREATRRIHPEVTKANAPNQSVRVVKASNYLVCIPLLVLYRPHRNNSCSNEKQAKKDIWLSGVKKLMHETG